jgi:hypothetical protein
VTICWAGLAVSCGRPDLPKHLRRFERSPLRLAALSTVIAVALAAGLRADAQTSSLDLRERFTKAGVPARPLDLALRAYACGSARGEFAQPVLTLIDYSRPSTAPRLWVLDLAEGRVRFHTLVAHGQGSGLARAVAFSNDPGSKQSSLGLFRTDEVYEGTHGYSLRLVGLESGVNDLAYPRNIVIHGADYATATFASRHGRLGRSWGCPALDPAVHRNVIDAIRGGSALFAYYPDAHWLASSPYLRCEAPRTIAASTVERSALRNRNPLVAPLAALVGAR